MKSTKKALIWAVSLIGVGLVICALVLLLLGGRWALLGRIGGASRTYLAQDCAFPADQVKALVVEDIDRDVTLQSGAGPEVIVRYYTREGQDYTFDLSPEGVLTIRNIIEKESFSITKLFSFFEEEWPKLVVTLPDTLTEGIRVECVSGDVHVSGLELGKALEVTTVSGDLFLSGVTAPRGFRCGSTSGDMRLQSLVLAADSQCKTASGDLALIDCRWEQGGLQVESISGDLELSRLATAGPMTIHTTSGDIDLEAVEAKGDVTVRTTSGDIDLEGVAGENLSFFTTSGDVEGYLLGDPADYLVRSSSTSGDLRLPQDSAAGNAPYTLTAETVSGDVGLQFRSR